MIGSRDEEGLERHFVWVARLLGESRVVPFLDLWLPENDAIAKTARSATGALPDAELRLRHGLRSCG